MSDPTRTLPAGDWTTLAHTVRERRWQLGIPTQQAAAERARLSLNSWQRLEASTPVSARTLQAASRALGWEPGALMAVLNGHPVPDDGEPAAPAAALPVGRPALMYHGTDGSVVQLDRDDLTTLPPRERALCAALLDHARHQLDHPGPRINRCVGQHLCTGDNCPEHRESPHA